MAKLPLLANKILDQIAPERCLSCLRIGSWLCDKCYLSVQKIQWRDLCIGCGGGTFASRTCESCRERVPLRGLVCAGSYKAEYLKRGVQWLKFKSVADVAPGLASLLKPRLSLIGSEERLRERAVLSPIPLHKRRERARGFNQAELIAKELSKLTEIPYLDSLVRKTYTAPQAQLSPILRIKNISEVFEVNQLPTKKTVILVDDVATTGATLNEAADCLKAAGAAQVWAACVARG